MRTASLGCGAERDARGAGRDSRGAGPRRAGARPLDGGPGEAGLGRLGRRGLTAQAHGPRAGGASPRRRPRVAPRFSAPQPLTLGSPGAWPLPPARPASRARDHRRLPAQPSRGARRDAVGTLLRHGAAALAAGRPAATSRARTLGPARPPWPPPEEAGRGTVGRAGLRAPGLAGLGLSDPAATPAPRLSGSRLPFPPRPRASGALPPVLDPGPHP